MIEKFFLLGLRLKWVFPGDHTTGSMDGSTIANPPRPIQTMVYNGLDGELYNLGAAHVSTVGLTMGMSIPHNWLIYSVGHVAKITLSTDTLTGYMSGCLIVLWSDGTNKVVGHVGTVDSSKTISERVKQAFAATLPNDATGFNPAKAWDDGEIRPMMAKLKGGAEPKIIALVTTGGQFYSIVMFKLVGIPNEWCVGGIKLVKPMDRNTLHVELMKASTAADG